MGSLRVPIVPTTADLSSRQRRSPALSEEDKAMPLSGERSRTMRARNLGLATVLALLAMLIPATAGVALGHHATVVVAQITCNGNVAYQQRQSSGAG